METAVFIGQRPEKIQRGSDGKIEDNLPPHLELRTPIMFSAMSYGAISLNVHKALAKAADLANHRAFVQRIAAHGTAALPVPLPAVAEQPAQRRHAHFSVARLELADSPAPAFFSRSIPSSSFSRRSMYS